MNLLNRLYNILTANLKPCILVASGVLFVFLTTQRAHTEQRKPESTVLLNGKRYDLAKIVDLDGLIATVKKLHESATKEHAKKSESDDDDESVHNPGSRDWSGSKVRHGLKAMLKIAESLRDGKLDSTAAIHDIQEIDWAVEANFSTPYTWMKSFDPFLSLLDVRNITLNACGRGSSARPATNLATYDSADLSTVDPMNSSYWSRPNSIVDKDMYTGFDRALLPDYGSWMFTYESPHKGYGVHPSFEASSHDSVWKIKFGEERSSGPFACRVYWALGFPCDIVDYMPEVRVKWDRRILSDFNHRQSNAMQLNFAGIPVTKLHQHAHFDPFTFIEYAVLKDGSRVESKQLEKLLSSDSKFAPEKKHSEDGATVTSKGPFESKIDYLVMADASITSKEKSDYEDLGFWDYNMLDHPDLREVRAMCLLNAWLDNWDIRYGNNRLEMIEDKSGKSKLEHVVSDLGAAFGNSSGMLRNVNGRLKVGLYQNAPNDYEWTCTHPQPAGRTTVPIRDYMPSTKTAPFYLMNIDDARWMARLIGTLTEQQLKQALIGAGFDAAESRLLDEKLVSRRDAMMRDLNLIGEYPPLRPNGVNRRLTYDPHRDGPVQADRPAGGAVVARGDDDYVLSNGKLKHIQHTATIAAN